MGSIVARHDSQASPHRLQLGARRSELPELVDHTSIALETLRTQWRTLADLGTHERMSISQLRIYGSMPMSELAARISLSRAALTSLVDRLEADGWLRRVPDTHDRRRTVLTLLPKAETQFTAISDDFRGQVAAIAGQLSDEEWRTITSFLHMLTDVAEKQAGNLRSTAVERTLT